MRAFPVRSNLPCSTVANIPPAEVLRTVIDQEHLLNDKGYRGTALHLTTESNNVPAARLLLENGASVDIIDSNGCTAIMKSSTEEVATLLLHSGASLVGHLCSHITACQGWGIDFFNKTISVYSEATTGQDKSNMAAEFLLDTYNTRGSVDCRKVAMSPAHLVSILKTDIDLKQEFGPERSLMHLAIVDQASSAFVLNSDLGVENSTPFPWHLMFWSDIAFLQSMFRHFRRKLTDRNFVKIANLHPSRGWSPLCVASAKHDIEMIRNCLSLRADVDFEGSAHGSALVLACACGYLDAVRVLVRAGASLFYKGLKGQKSVFTLCRSKRVKEWLLVERFTEQGRINTRPHWGNGKEVRPWAGIAMARLKLVGNRAIYYHETLVDYAGRLAKMRKEWQGKVIPPTCMEGNIYK